MPIFTSYDPMTGKISTRLISPMNINAVEVEEEHTFFMREMRAVQ